MALPAFSQPELERFTQTFTDLFDAADAESMTSYYTFDKGYAFFETLYPCCH